MNRILLTEDMAASIRELRLQKKIPSKFVADSTGKSASYISKLENGQIKSITKSEFDIILKLIFPECSSEQERIDKLIEYQITKCGFDAREKQIWFINLDMVHRLLPIPSNLIDDIQKLLDENNITIDLLIERINKNEELSNDERDDPDISYNEWFERKPSGIAIKMNLDKEYVEDIFAYRVDICNYITIDAIVHYLFKTILFGNETILSEENEIVLRKQKEVLLDKHKFFTLSRKEMLLSQARTKNQTNNILNEFDIEIQWSINSLLACLKAASDMNVVRTNKILKQLIENLNWDASFMLMLLGSNFSSIGECSFANKKQLLAGVKEQINIYRELPKEQKLLEEYDD